MEKDVLDGNWKWTMLPNDKISCLICCCSQDEQHDRLLERALSSIENQTHKLDEIILILNACWSHTMEVLNDYPYMDARKSGQLKIYEKPAKTGLASCKNFGLKYCAGDWITYCDADDAWLPCKLEVQRDYILNRSSDIFDDDFVFSESWDVYNAGYNEIWKPNCFRVGQFETHGLIYSRIFQQNVLCHGSALIKRRVLKELHGYSEFKEHFGQEDWELWKRAIRQGYQFYKVPERLYLYSMGTSVER